MAVLNSYISDDKKYDLLRESTDFQLSDKVHPSRLLNPKVFSLAETPIYEDGMINVGSLATAAKTYPFLVSFGGHIKDMTDYLFKKMNGDWFIERYNHKLNKGSQEVISGINVVKGKLSEDLAVITEYIVRHFPEDAKIIEKDWTRKNPYNWIGIIEENGESLFNHGFDNIECDDQGGTDLVFMPEYHDFTPQDIQVSEQQFITRVNRLASFSSKVNFAVESACLILNLLNYKFYKYELEEFEIDPNLKKPYLEELKQPVETSSGTTYCTRWFEAIFRNRRYTHKSKVPTHVDYYMDYNESSVPYFNFIKDQVKPYSNNLIEALLVLKTHNTSIGFKGRQLEKLKKVAEFYHKFLAARKTVINWYSTRFTQIDVKEMEAAMSFLLSKFDEVKALIDVRSKINMTLFVADQRVVSNAKRNGEELPALSEIKTELDAVEKLGPHLKKLGLKIVPVDQEDVTDKIKATEKNLSKAFAASFKVKEYLASKSHKLPPDAFKTPLEAWVPQSIPPAVSNVSASIVNSKESTGEFDQGFEYNQKVKRWKGTKVFNDYIERLGGGTMCNYEKIGAAYRRKQLMDPNEEGKLENLRREEKKKPPEERKTIKGIPGQIALNTARNEGRNFVVMKELEPIENFEILGKTEAALTVFNKVYRNKKKLTCITTDLKKAEQSLRDDEKFSTDTERVLKRHLKKLKLSKKDVEKASEEANDLVGRKKPVSNAKYDTEEVAVALCEHDSEKKNSGQ